MPYRFTFAAAVALSLAACGGGGSGSGPKMTTEVMPPAPPVTPQGDPARLARETGGPSAAEVLDYLGIFAGGHSGKDYQSDPGLSVFPE